jgi:hypothetical protein
VAAFVSFSQGEEGRDSVAACPSPRSPSLLKILRLRSDGCALTGATTVNAVRLHTDIGPVLAFVRTCPYAAHSPYRHTIQEV